MMGVKSPGILYRSGFTKSKPKKSKRVLFITHYYLSPQFKHSPIFQIKINIISLRIIPEV